MKEVKIIINLEDGRAINLSLYPEVAPLSVANFCDLIKSDFFNGLCFHRVISGFMIQGGGFTHGKELVQKNADKTVKGEFRSNGISNDLHHELGVISMARTNVKNSGTSQFFLCAGDCSFLDGEYAAFGKTTDADSNKIILDIAGVKTHRLGYYDDVPVAPIIIKNITITE